VGIADAPFLLFGLNAHKKTTQQPLLGGFFDYEFVILPA